jgi:hypothetical protein
VYTLKKEFKISIKLGIFLDLFPSIMCGRWSLLDKNCSGGPQTWTTEDTAKYFS